MEANRRARVNAIADGHEAGGAEPCLDMTNPGGVYISDHLCELTPLLEHMRICCEVLADAIGEAAAAPAAPEGSKAV